MHYWPCYSMIDPASRAAYLHWLASGRKDPAAAVGYVFLFFYGIERRVLVDAQTSEQARSEIDGLLAEVERLLGIYGGKSFVPRLCELLSRRRPSAAPSDRSGGAAAAARPGQLGDPALAEDRAGRLRGGGEADPSRVGLRVGGLLSGDLSADAGPTVPARSSRSCSRSVTRKRSRARASRSSRTRRPSRRSTVRPARRSSTRYR